jgi:hypothetical protein
VLCDLMSWKSIGHRVKHIRASREAAEQHRS